MITIAVDDNCNVLQFLIDDLKAGLQNKKLQLKWNAIAEKGNYWFDVERSNDGINFYKIATVNGIGHTRQHYQFTDLELLNGKKYYRVKMISDTQQEKLSNVIVVTDAMQTTFAISSLVNPFHMQVKFDLFAPLREAVRFQLIDAVGKELYSKSQLMNEGYNNVILDNLPSLSGGFYILRIYTSKGVIHQRINHVQ